MTEKQEEIVSAINDMDTGRYTLSDCRKHVAAHHIRGVNFDKYMQLLLKWKIAVIENGELIKRSTKRKSKKAWEGFFKRHNI